MVPELTTDEIFKRIISCMDDLSDAKGISRCGLMYALAQLIDTLQQKVSKDREDFIAKIAELESELKAKSETPEQEG